MTDRPSADWASILELAVHELRTPVSVVSGYGRMLLNEQMGPLSERQRKVVEQAVRSCGRLTQLIGELNDLAHLEAGTFQVHRQPVALFPLVAEAVVQAPTLDGFDVRVELAGDQDGAVIDGDTVALRSAFSALVTASVREAPPETLVEVRRVARPDGTAVIAIATPESVHQLLDSDVESLAPFDGCRPGVGMSLLVAGRVIELHGGRVLALPGERRKGALVVMSQRGLK